ncbi:patatin-like phospholipase family protein [bacterium]|jgi:NTE family protein|nr:patatin-like phospholipase family protein [bacterium]
MESRTGIVLTGGGARGAYQAGVLRGLAALSAEKSKENPFKVITGVSAGAINGAYLAAHCDDIMNATQFLWDMWSTVHTEKIFRSDPISLGRITFRWIMELSTGGFFQKKKSRALLDTTPLYDYIRKEIAFNDIQKRVKEGHLHALAVSALNYSTGFSRTFFQGDASIQPWERTRRKGERMKIKPEHILASAAIPLLFPPVKVGGHYFGDGSLRNYTPLSPAIKMGANKLIVISVRQREVGQLEEEMAKPTLGRIIGVVLNSVLMDAIDLDHERLTRINKTLRAVDGQRTDVLNPIDVITIRPSVDIAEIAKEEMSKMPLTIRHLIKGLGNEGEASDLISYLLFEPAFTQRLLELGYKDVMDKKEELYPFLCDQ